MSIVLYINNTYLKKRIPIQPAYHKCIHIIPDIIHDVISDIVSYTTLVFFSTFEPISLTPDSYMQQKGVPKLYKRAATVLPSLYVCPVQNVLGRVPLIVVRDRRPGPGARCCARIGADEEQGRSGRGLWILGRVATAGRRAASVAQWGEGEFTQRSAHAEVRAFLKDRDRRIAALKSRR